MMLGVNANHSKRYSARTVWKCSEWVRSIVYAGQEGAFTKWANQNRNLGTKVCAQIVRESVPGWSPDVLWTARDIQPFVDAYADLPFDMLCVCNEADNVGPSSWTMSPRQYVEFLVAFRQLPTYLIAGPMASVHGIDYMTQVNEQLGYMLSSYADSVSFNPYTGNPNADLHGYGDWYIGDVVTQYRVTFNMDVSIMEVGIGSAEIGLQKQAHYYHDLARFGQTYLDLARLALFCMSDEDVPTYGMRKENSRTKPSWKAWLEGAGWL